MRDIIPQKGPPAPEQQPGRCTSVSPFYVWNEGFRAVRVAHLAVVMGLFLFFSIPCRLHKVTIRGGIHDIPLLLRSTSAFGVRSSLPVLPFACPPT